MARQWKSAEDALYVKNDRGEFKTVDCPIEGAVHYKWIGGKDYEKVDVGSGSSGAGRDGSWKDWTASCRWQRERAQATRGR